MRTRCNLITGFLGAGKTTLIRHLLSQRPEGERWAVIVNEFGVVGIDGTTLGSTGAAASGIDVREVAGGCICCAANVPLRVAITDVLRRVRPGRLLVEPSGLGHPAAILSTLAEPGLASALSIGPVVCVVDPRHALPGEGSQDPLDDTWLDQVALADVVVANKRDLVDDARHRTFIDWLDTLYPPRQAVVSAVEGRMPVELLDAPRAPWRPVLAGGHDAGATAVLEPPVAVPGLGTRHAATSGSSGSIGWLFDDPSCERAVFDADRIDRLMVGLSTRVAATGGRLLRAKAALRTDHGTRLIEWSSGQIRSSPLSFTGPARFELLFDAGDSASSPLPAGIATTLVRQIETMLLEALASQGEH